MCIYGIELLDDNVAECRQSLLETFTRALMLKPDADLSKAAAYVLSQNIVHGDALTMLTRGEVAVPITFAEWGYLGKGKFKRRDFRYEALTKMSSFSAAGTLFADLAKHEVFTPTRDYPAQSVKDLADD